MTSWEGKKKQHKNGCVCTHSLTDRMSQIHEHCGGAGIVAFTPHHMLISRENAGRSLGGANHDPLCDLCFTIRREPFSVMPWL